MKKVLGIILFVLMFGAVNAQHFEGFYYGMPKELQKELVVKKIKEGLFIETIGKRHVLLNNFGFRSEFMLREFQISVVFKHVNKQLSLVQIMPFSEASNWGGGMSRKKATILKREFEEYVNSLGYTVNMELEQTASGYYNLYMPIGEIELPEEQPELSNFR